MKKLNKVIAAALVAGSFAVSTSANAACGDVSRSDLQDALSAAVGTVGGFGLPMWLTFVDETGKVCQVVTSGETGKLAGNTEWLGSRVISAQKANTANAFSLNDVSISSGALMAGVQPGASLFGLSDSNPVNAAKAYSGNPSQYGKNNDPLKGKRIGGINTFGGGIALYDEDGEKVGAIGVSGDTSCTDHATAWAVRDTLGLGENSPGGFEVIDINAGGFADLGDHADCPLSTGDVTQNELPGFADDPLIP